MLLLRRTTRFRIIWLLGCPVAGAFRKPPPFVSHIINAATSFNSRFNSWLVFNHSAVILAFVALNSENILLSASVADARLIKALVVCSWTLDAFAVPNSDVAAVAWFYSFLVCKGVVYLEVSPCSINRWVRLPYFKIVYKLSCVEDEVECYVDYLFWGIRCDTWVY